MNFKKEDLYTVLRCIDRIVNHLRSKKVVIPEIIEVFLDELWMLLRGIKIRIALKKIDQRIATLIIDEQDANFNKSLMNRLYYALSALIIYLKEGDPS